MRGKLAGLIFLAVLCLVSIPATVSAQDDTTGEVEIISSGQAYRSYLAVPEGNGPFPAIVLLHSFRGFEEGYQTMSDQLATEGFVVLAPGWQTFGQEVDDATVQQLLVDSVAFLQERGNVDMARIGLTGFCAGGRYTMLFLPQIKEFTVGVAWYGFPARGEPSPVDVIGELDAPMLIIHGTEDEPSPIADIYAYATDLQAADKYFELKVYAGEPHGFMLENSQLRTDDVAADAYNEMVDFFTRKLTVDIAE
jgi:carboxymethylenebutenolidase